MSDLFVFFSRLDKTSVVLGSLSARTDSQFSGLWEKFPLIFKGFKVI